MKNIFLFGSNEISKLFSKHILLSKKYKLNYFFQSKKYKYDKSVNLAKNSFINYKDFIYKKNDIANFLNLNSEILKFEINDIIYICIDKLSDLNKILKKLEKYNFSKLIISINFNENNHRLIKEIFNEIIKDKYKYKKLNFNLFIMYDLKINATYKKLFIYYFFKKNYSYSSFRIKNYSVKTNQQKVESFKHTFPENTDDTPYGPQHWFEYENTPDYSVERNFYLFFFNNVLSFSNLLVFKIFAFFSKFFLFFKQFPHFKLINQIFYSPKNKILRHLRMLDRLCNVFIMYLGIFIFPKYIYFFSKRKFLPKIRKKMNFKINSFADIPFKVDIKNCHNVKYYNEINILMRGDSLHNQNIKNINGPTFLVSIVNPIERDKIKKIIKNDTDLKENYIFIYNSFQYIEALKKEGYECIAIESLEESKKNDSNVKKKLLNVRDKCKNINLPYIQCDKSLFSNLNTNSWTPTGSGLICLCSLIQFSKVVNVYGWDFHLKKSPKDMNIFQLLYNTYDYNCDMRSKSHFESMLINLYFAYQLSKLDNVNIYSYLGELAKHKKFIKRIHNIFYD